MAGLASKPQSPSNVSSFYGYAPTSNVFQFQNYKTTDGSYVEIYDYNYNPLGTFYLYNFGELSSTFTFDSGSTYILVWYPNTAFSALGVANNCTYSQVLTNYAEQLYFTGADVACSGNIIYLGEPI